jgi:hypothetical protein
MTAFFVLILFIESGGIRVGEYRTFEACEKAGYMASKSRQIEFVCIPADRR